MSSPVCIHQATMPDGWVCWWFTHNGNVIVNPTRSTWIDARADITVAYIAIHTHVTGIEWVDEPRALL